MEDENVDKKALVATLKEVANLEEDYYGFSQHHAQIMLLRSMAMGQYWNILKYLNEADEGLARRFKTISEARRCLSNLMKSETEISSEQPTL